MFLQIVLTVIVALFAAFGFVAAIAVIMAKPEQRPNPHIGASHVDTKA